MSLVLGETIPDPVGVMLGTGFLRFCSPCGLEGLAKENGRELVILAVSATYPGNGQFRTFISEAKAQYERIVILEVMNDWLGAVLQRYGFACSDEWFDGERMQVWRWIQ